MITNNTVIEKDQLWIRRIDHRTIVIDDVLPDYVRTYEYRNKDEKGFFRMKSFLDTHYLMPIDDAMAEIGGIF